MKKQETPAQPQVVPDAVLFPTHGRTSASRVRTTASRFVFPMRRRTPSSRPRPPGSALFSFPNAQSDNFPRPLKIAATPNRRPSNPVSRRIKSGATSNASRPPPRNILNYRAAQTTAKALKQRQTKLTRPPITAKASKQRQTKLSAPNQGGALSPRQNDAKRN